MRAATREEQQRIIDYRGVSVAFFVEEAAKVTANPPTQLYILLREIQIPFGVVAAGTSVSLEKRLDAETIRVRVPRQDYVLDLRDGVDVEMKEPHAWTIEDFAEFVVLPITRQMPDGQQFYINTAPSFSVGKEYQGTFVSQARKCKLTDLVKTLQEHFLGHDLSQTFIWLDLFSANQPLLTAGDHLSGQRQTTREDILTRGLHNAISKFDEFCLFFDLWDKPAPLHRAWCVWEILGAVRCSKNICVIYAPGEEASFTRQLVVDNEAIFKAIAQDMDMRDAQCWSTADKYMIDQAIATILPGGFVELNSQINIQVRKWLDDMTERALDRARNAYLNQDCSCDQFCELLYNASALAQKSNDNVTALNRVEECYTITMAQGPARSRYQEAVLLSTIAMLNAVLGNLPKSEELMNESFALARSQDDQYIFWSNVHRYAASLAQHDFVLKAKPLLKLCLEKFQEGVGPYDSQTISVMCNYADVLQLTGELKAALHILESARDLQTQSLGHRHNEVAETSRDIAAIYSKMKQYSKALEILDTVLETQQETIGASSPSTLITQSNIAGIFQRQRRYAAALELYFEVLTSRRNVLGQYAPCIGITLTNIACIYLNTKDYEKSLQYHIEAQEVREVVYGPTHPSVGESLFNQSFPLEKLGRFNDSLERLEQAIQIFSMTPETSRKHKIARWRRSQTRLKYQIHRWISRVD